MDTITRFIFIHYAQGWTNNVWCWKRLFSWFKVPGVIIKNTLLRKSTIINQWNNHFRNKCYWAAIGWYACISCKDLKWIKSCETRNLRVVTNKPLSSWDVWWNFREYGSFCEKPLVNFWVAIFSLFFFLYKIVQYFY